MTTVLLASFVTGLVGTAFAASAAVLRARGLSDAQYGSLFVPLVALAALGAVGGGPVVERIGAKRALALGFLFMALSQAALARDPVRGRQPRVPRRAPRHALLGLGAGRLRGPAQRLPPGPLPLAAARARSWPCTHGGGGPRDHSPAGRRRPRSRRLAGRAPSPLRSRARRSWSSVERENLPEPEARGEARSRPIGDARAEALPRDRIPLRRQRVHLRQLGGVCTSPRSGGSTWPPPASPWPRSGPRSPSAASPSPRSSCACRRRGCCPCSPRSWRRPACSSRSSTTPRRAVLLYALGGLGCSAVLPARHGPRPADASPRTGPGSPRRCTRPSARGIGVGSFSAGLLRSGLDLGTIYRLAAFPPAVAFLLALRAIALPEPRERRA